MNTTQIQMGNGLNVKVNTMTPWELERVNFQLNNGSHVKYEVTNIDIRKNIKIPVTSRFPPPVSK